MRIIGYNHRRPTEEDYQGFVEKLVTGLSGLGIENLSLMLYGSYVRGDFMPGRSDIDAVLAFPGDNVVIDKDALHECSMVLAWALKTHPVPRFR